MAAKLQTTFVSSRQSRVRLYIGEAVESETRGRALVGVSRQLRPVYHNHSKYQCNASQTERERERRMGTHVLAEPPEALAVTLSLLT